VADGDVRPGTSYHCELAWLGGDRAVADVLVEIDGDRIVAVEPDVSAPPGATRLAGLTLPGLADAHSHAFHRALRARAESAAGTFWTWREDMYALAGVLQPDTYRELARAAFGEMALAGITCVGEFHYLHHDVDGTPYADPNAMAAALAEAAGESGLRITLLDTCYLHGGIGVPVDGVQRRFADDDALSWAARASASLSLESSTVRVGAAIHSVRAVDPASIEVVTAWAAGHRSLHAHVSEQPAENDQCRSAYGLTPTELLAERGALGGSFTAVHATHASEHDIELLGSGGCTACLCPTTERHLADGIGPARALRDAGASLAIGSDSHAVVDLFEEARAVELDERLASLVRGSHDAPSLLRAATVHGHECLGWPEAGRIEAGAIADLVTVALDSVRTAGAGPALETAVFAATAADVRHVVAGGRVVVDGGTHVALDVAAELSRAVGRWSSGR
jgi:formiminoglutamate deiminase